MAGRILALELGSEGLRAAVIESTLRRFGISELHELDDAGFAERLGTQSWDRVVVGLAGETAVFRFLDLPFSDRRRIRQAAAVALEDHVPFSLEQVETAWDRSSTRHRQRILAAMAPRDRLDATRRRLSVMGIEQAELVWMPTAALECFRRSEPADSTYIAVVASPGSTTVAAVREGELDGLRLVADGPGDRGARDLAWAVASLAPDIERVIYAGPNTAEATERLARRLQTQKIEALAGPCPVEAPDLLAEQWTEQAGLVGLVEAAAGEQGSPAICFHHGTASLPSGIDEDLPRQLGRWAAAAALLLLAATAIDHVRLLRTHNSLLERADAISSRVMPSARGSGRRLKLEMRLSELEGRAGSDRKAQGYSSPLAALAAMSSTVPAEIEVELNAYKYDPPSLRLGGHADAYEAVTKLEEALRGHNAFARVEVVEVHTDVAGTGVDFRLELTLAEPGGES